MSDFEAAQAIVMDIGCYTIKAGFAGDDSPCCIIPTVHETPRVSVNKIDTYKERNFNLNYPIKKGIIQNFDIMVYTLTVCFIVISIK